MATELPLHPPPTILLLPPLPAAAAQFQSSYQQDASFWSLLAEHTYYLLPLVFESALPDHMDRASYYHTAGWMSETAYRVYHLLPLVAVLAANFVSKVAAAARRPHRSAQTCAEGPARDTPHPLAPRRLASPPAAVLTVKSSGEAGCDGRPRGHALPSPLAAGGPIRRAASGPALERAARRQDGAMSFPWQFQRSRVLTCKLTAPEDVANLDRIRAWTIAQASTRSRARAHTCARARARALTQTHAHMIAQARCRSAAAPGSGPAAVCAAGPAPGGIDWPPGRSGPHAFS